MSAASAGRGIAAPGVEPKIVLRPSHAAISVRQVGGAQPDRLSATRDRHLLISPACRTSSTGGPHLGLGRGRKSPTSDRASSRGGHRLARRDKTAEASKPTREDRWDDVTLRKHHRQTPHAGWSYPPTFGCLSRGCGIIYASCQPVFLTPGNIFKSSVFRFAFSSPRMPAGAARRHRCRSDSRLPHGHGDRQDDGAVFIWVPSRGSASAQ